MTLEVSEARILSCSQCEDGHYVRAGDDARCIACPNVIYIPRDMEPYLEPGEYLVTLRGGALAYFHTESSETED